MTRSRGVKLVTLAIFGAFGVGIYFWLIAPGLSSIRLPATLPEPPDGIVGFALTDVNSDTSVSITVNGRTSSSSANPYLEASFDSTTDDDDKVARGVLVFGELDDATKQDPEEVAEESIALDGAILGSPLADGLLCTQFESFQDGVGYKTLTPETRQIVDSAIRAAVQPPDPGDSGSLTDREVAAIGGPMTFTVVSLAPDSTRNSTRSTGDGDESFHKLWSSECTFPSDSAWDVSGSEHRFRFPRLVIRSPTDTGFRISTDTSVAVESNADLLLIRNDPPPNETTSEAYRWRYGYSPDDALGVDSLNYLRSTSGSFLFATEPVGAVFTSASAAKAEQYEVFLSGVGLGLLAAIAVWATPEIISEVPSLCVRLRRRRVATSAEADPEDGRDAR